MQRLVWGTPGYPGIGTNCGKEFSAGDLDLTSSCVDPEKGYISYSTFPDFEPTQPSSPLERGPLNMARVTVIVFVCLTLLFTYTAALPLDLWSVLTGRQLSTPPPASFSNNHVPQNITAYDAKNWVLSTTTFIPNHYQTQPYVANGYHGSRVPAEGIGFWVCFRIYIPFGSLILIIPRSRAMIPTRTESTRSTVGRSTTHAKP